MSRKRQRPGRAGAGIGPDYLRTLGSDVDAALALLVHDIVATGALPAGHHPNHPLWLRGQRSGEPTDDPVWTCTANNRAVAELGKL